MTMLAEASVSTTPVATGKLVRTWFILLPLLYYANSGFPGAADTTTATNFSRTHQIGLLVVSIICSALIFKKLAVIFASSVRMRLIVALPMLAILSCLWSVDPRQSLVSAITLLCFTLFAIYLSEAFTIDGQLDLIMLTGAIAVPASIALALFVPSIGASSSGWRGIFTHKQQCAAAVTLFLVTALHWKPNRPIQRPLRAIYIVLCIGLIIMSQSRTGWLLTLFAIALSASLWFLQKLAAKDAFFLVLISIPIVGGLLYLLSLLASIILTSVGKDPTLSERTIIWSAVWDAITQHPWLGYGYEAFWQGLQGASKNVVLIAGWGLSQAQSGYLDLWLQLGVCGVIILVLMTAQAATDVFRSFRATANATFVRWCAVVILCNLIYNIGESDFGYLRILWLLFVLACIGLRKEASSLEKSGRRVGILQQQLPRTSQLGA
jgi:exopolysaccharide production protein ExoQ